MLPLNRILYPTDFSEGSKHAFPHALHLARRHGAIIHVIHAMAYVLHEYPNIEQDFEAEANRQMGTFMEGFDTSGIDLHYALKWGDSEALAIVEYAGKESIDLIVMGTYGRSSVTQRLFGGVVGQVIRRAGCPVLAVHAQDIPFPVKPVRRILVPLELSEHDRRALTHALDLAKSYDAQIEVLHVVHRIPPPSVYELETDMSDTILDAIRERVMAEMERELKAARVDAVTTPSALAVGRPASYIVEYARDHAIDLVVLAPHSPTGIKRLFLGSVAEEVIRTAPCPVYIAGA